MHPQPNSTVRYEQLAAHVRAENRRRRKFTRLILAAQNRAQFEQALRAVGASS